MAAEQTANPQHHWLFEGFRGIVSEREMCETTQKP